jgi:hypothetical protein
MRKILSSVCILLIFVGFLALPLITYAHFAATNGTMTVTLHTDPDDNPISGQTAYLYFLFNDKTKKFHLNECNCVVSVYEQGKQIFQQKLLDKRNPHSSVWGANIPIVFPEKDVYLITIKGDPVTSNAFRPFFLSWYFRVDTTAPGLVKQAPSDILVLVASWAIGIVVLVFIGLFIKKEVLSAEAGDNHKKRP